MFGTTDQGLNELAVVSAQCAFWSNVAHVQNHDHNAFLKELLQIGEPISKQKIGKKNFLVIIGLDNWE